MSLDETGEQGISAITVTLAVAAALVLALVPAIPYLLP